MKIHSTDNGKTGLELFKKISPDIVLTDINLPMLNGILMASEIRKLNYKTEIIFLSGQEKTCYESDCVKIGISQYLNKPIQHEVLFEAIEDSLARIIPDAGEIYAKKIMPDLQV
jgi:YesN/AraC family two-component response regulator